MTTAADIIGKALHLFGLIDETEDPSASDLTKNVPVLNDMLRSEMSDGAAQFLMKSVTAQLPPGVNGQVYTFSIGTANTAYLVQTDAVALKSIWVNDVSPTINRPTRQSPKADVVRTLTPGRVMKWHQERQIDGSILVTAWQAPATTVQVLLDLGGRVAPLTAADGSDVVGLPPEGIHDASLMLGLTICGSYGKPIGKIDPILAQRAEMVNKRWRDWARGQQWLSFVRS